MTVKTVGRWQIEFDPAATASCYKEIVANWYCDCAPCRNFLALGDKVFPRFALNLFEQLGVDVWKPAEVYHNAREENGLHNYGGWFHFVGRVESGADALRQVGNEPCSGVFELEPVGENFKFGFSNCLGLVPKQFDKKAIVQLEFITQVEWTIAEPEPS